MGAGGAGDIGQLQRKVGREGDEELQREGEDHVINKEHPARQQHEAERNVFRDVFPLAQISPALTKSQSW